MENSYTPEELRALGYFFVFFISAIFSLVIFVNTLVERRNSFLYSLFRRVYKKYTKQPYLSKPQVEEANTLYPCTNCERYIRRYQLNIIVDSGKPLSCPHCRCEYRKIKDLDNRSYRISPKNIYYQDPLQDLEALQPADFEEWVDETFDAPYKNRKELQTLFAQVEEIQLIAAEKKAIDRYNEYSNKDRSNWTENIFEGYKE